MSAADKTPAPEIPEHQFKVKISDAVALELFAQKEALGFHSENSLATIYITAFSGVPANKAWEALAKVRAYVPAKKGTR
jgi:histidinol dehydrogenase